LPCPPQKIATKMNDDSKKAVSRAASDQKKFEQALKEFKKTNNPETIRKAKNRIDKNSTRT